MGNCLSSLYDSLVSQRTRVTILNCTEVRMLCERWKEIDIPFFMSVNEFKKSLVRSETMHIDFSKATALSGEVEVIEFLTSLLILSIGSLTQKLECLFYLYQLEDDSGDEMTPEEFFSCVYKTLKAMCNIGEIQFPYIETQALEVFKDEVSRGENINLEHFKQVVSRECQKFAGQLQDTGLYMRTLSTLLVDNPFPVLPFLQKGNLFLGKYEIVAEPVVIDSISSYYKRRYKHAFLDAKQMLGNEKLSFELIYLSGLKGDHSFRQNFFREIVLKNKMRKEQVTEFGELPGGILYKVITEVEATPMTLKEYLEEKTETTTKSYPPTFKRRRLYCMSERETIELGLQLLEQLETLHNMHVLHSNINPSSVYLVESDIKHLQFLDLELAVWEPLEILGVNSTYFSQYKEDIFDTTFRIEDFIAPEHRELAEEFRRTGRVPRQSITQQCDLYSIGAILFQALTGKTLKKVLEQMNTEGEHTEEDVFRHKVMDQLIASSDMLEFLEHILSKDLKVRHDNILTVKTHLTTIKEKLDRLPEQMLLGLEHIAAPREMFEDSYSLDLREFEMNDFAQSYLYKYILESDIPNICLFGEKLPLRSLRDNSITELILTSAGLYSEDLKTLSLFLAINSSVIVIDISKNPVIYRHESGIKDIEDRDDSLMRLTDYCTDEGVLALFTALSKHATLQKFGMAGIHLGADHAQKLCEPLALNSSLVELNLADCDLGADGTKAICRVLETFTKLKYVNFSSNRLGDSGATYIARLIEQNHHIIEIDLFRNNIGQQGGEQIGKALTTNFIIQNLSIGDNLIAEKEMNLILYTVMFNTQYTKLKATNERFGEFGYNLLAESIRRWAQSNAFVLDKIKARLMQCEDAVDFRLKSILMSSSGEIMLDASFGSPKAN